MPDIMFYDISTDSMESLTQEKFDEFMKFIDMIRQLHVPCLRFWQRDECSRQHGRPLADPSSLACSLDHCQKQELVSRSYLNFLIFL